MSTGDRGPLTLRLGENVFRLRQARGLTVRALASLTAALGHRIPPSSISKIEKGIRWSHVDDLAVLAAVFGVEPGLLLAPPPCDTCLGCPPAGFRCMVCEAET